jgi:hypothetical protein
MHIKRAYDFWEPAGDGVKLCGLTAVANSQEAALVIFRQYLQEVRDLAKLELLNQGKIHLSITSVLLPDNQV